MLLRSLAWLGLTALLPTTLAADEFIGPGVGSGVVPGFVGLPPVGVAHHPGWFVHPPYPSWGPAPYHGIYGYMPTWDSGFDRYGLGTSLHRSRSAATADGYQDERYGRSYRGRSELFPAMPYSEYLRARQNDPALQASRAEAATVSQDRAVIEVHVPVSTARVTFDDQVVAGEGTIRLFQTPPLQAGQEYRFRIRAAWFGRDAQDETADAVVSFRAGERKVVELKRR